MKERIVAAVVDTRLLTLYRDDGTSFTLPQSDPRVRDIIDQVMPLVQKGQTAHVEIEATDNVYRSYEDNSSGFVKMFRVAKKAIVDLFADNAPEERGQKVDPVTGVYGRVPQEAIDLIMQQAQSVQDKSYSSADTTSDHTMIAVLNGNQIIPGIEDLEDQFRYASTLGSTQALDAFFRRLSPVIDQRPHSVRDLLTFLKKGDLPIAEDGCIVAYKILKQSSESKDIFLDCHTGKVKQREGSYVCVDHSLVDMSRHNECSNGLHIARRSYIGNFHGDLVTMCKIRPEDVMTVPHGDANKVRVCGYHILYRLPDDAFRLLKDDKAATTNRTTAALLSLAITGRHSKPVEEVRITQQRGEGVVITPMDQASNISMGLRKDPAGEKSAPAPSHKALDEAQKLEKAEIKRIADEVNKGRKANTPPSTPPAKPVQAEVEPEPKAAAKTSKPAKGKQTVTITKTTTSSLVRVPDQARKLYDEKRWAELLAFKKAKKKSWKVLGFTDAEATEIMSHGG